MAVKVNSGFQTVISIDGVRYVIDGYLKKALVEDIIPSRYLVALNWTNHIGTTPLVLSISTFISDGNESIEVDIEDIDPYEHHTFSSQTKVAEAIVAWFNNHPNA